MKGLGIDSNLFQFYCAIFSAILCTYCKKWIHKKCSRVVGRLKKGGDFKCRKCSEGGVKVVDEVRQLCWEQGRSWRLLTNFVIWVM